MPVDQSVVGKELPPLTMTVDAGRLRFFAKAIGETNPVFTDLGAAKAAGHRDLPVPPTFLFGIELESPDPFGWLSGIGVDLRRVLHGEQSFTYHSPAVAGDVLTVAPRIGDVYSKKGGTLEFIEKASTVTRENGDLVAELKTVIAVRNPARASGATGNTPGASEATGNVGGASESTGNVGGASEATGNVGGASGATGNAPGASEATGNVKAAK